MMSEYNKDNLFDPCTELECLEKNIGPDCILCELGVLREKLNHEKLKNENLNYENEKLRNIVSSEDYRKLFQ